MICARSKSESAFFVDCRPSVKLRLEEGERQLCERRRSASNVRSFVKSRYEGDERAGCMRRGEAIWYVITVRSPKGLNEEERLEYAVVFN